MEDVFAAAERLKEFPFSGREVEEVHREEIREIVFGGIRIMHRVEAERVIILTVRHQRQLFDESDTQVAE